MNGEFIYILCVLATVAFCSFAMYSGADNHSSRLALGAVLMAALISPVLSLIREPPGMDFEAELPEAPSSDTAELMVREAFLKGIRLAAADKFDLYSADISVECEGFVFSELRAEKIKITLSGRAVFADAKRIKSYIETEGFGECEVILDFERHG